MVLSALTVCCEEISYLKTFVDRQTAQSERQNDRRYALVHGFLLTAPVVMDIPRWCKSLGYYNVIPGFKALLKCARSCQARTHDRRVPADSQATVPSSPPNRAQSEH
ncbi:hypothetical protein PoB_000073700 [Plakobranchus ocellatus]|uniref:Uncharacterized protein n=1 Tax=Plakobranchus ocellatus TaxID=259542 RepID=A0AAV3XVS7_9GAST|nr:hypothetical protein PoB_000073700 [Plakobranchus ocellatus]